MLHKASFQNFLYEIKILPLIQAVKGEILITAYMTLHTNGEPL